MAEKFEKLIEKINVLGPWVHGYFNLKNGIIIQDKDELQRKRLFSTRNAFFKILKQNYSEKELKEKTLCDVGCNTGYFLFEIFNKFKIKRGIGIDPRKWNLEKARFIAKYFKLPKNRYQLKQADILGKTMIPKSDIVIVPGVMHHLDNHLKALEKIYSITNELCIIETMVISDNFNTKEIADQLELKDILYQSKKSQNQFGIIGLKLESDGIDGATIHPGIVAIPTTQALILMMKHVGFNTTNIFLSEKQLSNKNSYRELRLAIVVGKKEKEQAYNYFKGTIANIEIKTFDTCVPYEIIRDLYCRVNDKTNQKITNGISNLIYESEVFFKTKKGQKAGIELKNRIGEKEYFKIIQTFKHAPYEKICFEYSKTCYHMKKIKEANEICINLIKIMNLDWRVVYQTYFLLAKINFDSKNFNRSKKYNLLSIKANPNYTLSKELMMKIQKNKAS